MKIGQKVKVKIVGNDQTQEESKKDRYFNGKIIAETPYYFVVQGKKYRESFMNYELLFIDWQSGDYVKINMI